MGKQTNRCVPLFVTNTNVLFGTAVDSRNRPRWTSADAMDRIRTSTVEADERGLAKVDASSLTDEPDLLPEGLIRSLTVGQWLDPCLPVMPCRAVPNSKVSSRTY